VGSSLARPTRGIAGRPIRLQSAGLEDSRTSTDAAEDKEPLLCLATLLEQANGEMDNDREAAKSLLTRARSLVRAQLDRDDRGLNLSKMGGLAGWQCRQISLFIDTRLDQTISVKALSSLSKLSNSYFIRAFKRTFNVTPHAYVIGRRLKKAKALMLTTDLTLSEIAVSCGFTDQAHLSKKFRQNQNQSPAAWRRERTELVRRKRRTAVGAPFVASESWR
jgi:AraC family transcriptional regulator